MEGTGTGWRLAGLAVAWLCGVAWQLHERNLMAAGTYAGLAAAGVLALAARQGLAGAGRPVAAIALVLGLAGAGLLGGGGSGLRAALRAADRLPASLEGRDIVATGVVASLPQASASGWRFRFQVEAATLKGQAVVLPPQIALGWYKGFHADAALSQPQSELRAGQRGRFTVRLRRPHGNLNPNGFDYELALFEQGLRATGYVRDDPALRLDDAAGYPVERLRQRARDAIDASVTDHRAAGVLAALSIGDQGAIERDDWDLYRNTGIAHLVSISGLHVTMFAWLAGLALAAAWRRSERAMLWLPVPLAARWGGFAAAGAYAVFSGWGVPSQRTVWMLATVTLLHTLGVRWPWALVLLAAAVIVTAIDPWALTQAGFWLSFAAVGLLMASATAHGDEAGEGQDAGSPPAGWRAWCGRQGRRLWGTVHDGLRTQVIATLGLTPLTLIFFQQVSLVGFAANLVAISLVTLVITPLALAGVALVPLWWAGAWVVQQMNAALATLAAWPGAVWSVPVAPPWAQALGLLAAALLVMPLPWRARFLAVPLALPLMMPPRDAPADGAFELLAADVGQGTAVVVRTRRHLLVFDAGPQYSAESDAGQRVLLPLLRAHGDTRIDRLILSHRDLDHVGGARAILNAMPVATVLSSLEREHPLLAQAADTARCETGQAWRWDDVDFAMLRPPPGDYGRSLKSNALSCVLRVSAGGRSALLTGDIEGEQEAALVAERGAGLRSEVLIVPHHGSRTSSTAAFLDAVQPRVAVFQAGYRNRFGHPAPDVVGRYRERGIGIVASPSCGAWRWSTAGDPDGSCLRDAEARYWHLPGDAAAQGTALERP